MPGTTAEAYRSVLDRLRGASRTLADYIETSSEGEAEVTVNPRFFEIWADYKRALAESQDTFQRLPSRLKMGAPRPPRE